MEVRRQEAEVRIAPAARQPTRTEFRLQPAQQFDRSGTHSYEYRVGFGEVEIAAGQVSEMSLVVSGHGFSRAEPNHAMGFSPCCGGLYVFIRG
jgi:hypothetical protein